MTVLTIRIGEVCLQAPINDVYKKVIKRAGIRIMNRKRWKREIGKGNVGPKFRKLDVEEHGSKPPWDLVSTTRMLTELDQLIYFGRNHLF
jgi:hypothetical protein